MRSSDRSTRPSRSHGPAVGEPPVLVDPRRWGALIGIVGGLVFIFSYAPALSAPLSVGAETIGIALAVAALVGHYLRPTSLGPFREPSCSALVVYLGCVAGELAAIAVGSRLLTRLAHGDVRPALIAAVVGVHFLPFGWAFHERMFYPLGSALLALGIVGLAAGFAGVTHAAETAAVLSGLVMLALTALHAHGRFARHDRE